MLAVNLLAYFEDTQHAGALAQATHHLTAGSEREGRWVAMDLQVVDERIAAVGYQVFGCPYTIALTEYLARALQQQTITALSQWQWPAEVLVDIPAHKQSVLLLLQRLLQLKPAID